MCSHLSCLAISRAKIYTTGLPLYEGLLNQIQWQKTSRSKKDSLKGLNQFISSDNKPKKPEWDDTKLGLSSGFAYTTQLDIDSGAFASVEKAVVINTKVVIAVKKIEIPREVDDPKTRNKRKSITTDIKNELFILQKIRHPHVIKLIQHFIINDRQTNKTIIYILMQFAPGGTLSSHCNANGPFDERMCQQWFAQMLSALSFMHSKKMAHRDLKLSNILLNENMDVLVSDFGLSRVVWRQTQGTINSNTYCGTPPYMCTA
ncbi:unnamed protein product [Oppiella nova]|uniref:Protein kinase domain-containing protein n=1 Tax=Oppiella nova TaxID=334625 RepID=A0A7R9M606_9ACAR|nr:unnamed protein product [Oppiella nova]CAG2171420.1 unnamed protein product [Oppiella nova]